jgi:hypothetical protein
MMSTPRLDWRVNIASFSWTVFASIIGCVFAFAVLQGDVRALISRVDDHRTRIDRLEAKRNIDRDTIAEMKGDIRVIRQILEGNRR